MLYLSRLYHLAEGSETRPFPEGADLNAISTPLSSIRADTYALPRPFSSSRGERNQAVIIYPGGADLNALCLYPPSRGSRLYIAWTPKSVSKAFIIYFRGANLNAPLTSLSSIPGEQVIHCMDALVSL